MSCYICLEEDGVLMQSKGCDCKGSIAIHEHCLQEWMNTAENPFQCSVCKTDYRGTFLANFLPLEEIMFRGAVDEEEEEEVELFEFHGITITSSEDALYFDSEEHKSIYFQTNLKEEHARRHEIRHRQKNAVRIQAKPVRIQTRTRFVSRRK